MQTISACAAYFSKTFFTISLKFVIFLIKCVLIEITFRIKIFMKTRRRLSYKYVYIIILTLYINKVSHNNRNNRLSPEVLSLGTSFQMQSSIKNVKIWWHKLQLPRESIWKNRKLNFYTFPVRQNSQLGYYCLLIPVLIFTTLVTKKVVSY